MSTCFIPGTAEGSGGTAVNETGNFRCQNGECNSIWGLEGLETVFNLGQHWLDPWQVGHMELPSLKYSPESVGRQGRKRENNYRTTEPSRVALTTRSERTTKPLRCQGCTQRLGPLSMEGCRLLTLTELKSKGRSSHALRDSSHGDSRLDPSSVGIQDTPKAVQTAGGSVAYGQEFGLRIKQALAKTQAGPRGSCVILDNICVSEPQFPHF